MKKSGSRWFALLSLAAGLSASFSASADWTFGGATSGGPAYTSIAGSPASDPSLTISGAYAANGGTLTSGASGTSIVAGNSYGISGFANAATWTVNSSSTLQYYGGNGLGMSSDSTLSQAPNHALDNGVSTGATDLISGLGNTEAVMLSFNSSVVLSSIGIGYVFGDADVSVFRYIGSNIVAPALNGTTASLSGMQGAGWQLVGNYGDLAVDTTSPYNAVNAGNVGSSWWLITAYNSSYGAATTGVVSQGNDFFKIYAVAGTKCVSTGGGSNCGAGPSGSKIPEPGSLALVSVGLVGALGLRRRSLASRA
jgi:hypothetical protein